MTQAPYNVPVIALNYFPGVSNKVAQVENVKSFSLITTLWIQKMTSSCLLLFKCICACSHAAVSFMKKDSLQTSSQTSE